MSVSSYIYSGVLMSINNRSGFTKNIYTRIIPFGFIAFSMSYALNKSIIWALLHAFCGGWYVLYWLFSYTNYSEYINSWVN